MNKLVVTILVTVSILIVIGALVLAGHVLSERRTVEMNRIHVSTEEAPDRIRVTLRCETPFNAVVYLVAAEKEDPAPSPVATADIVACRAELGDDGYACEIHLTARDGHLTLIAGDQPRTEKSAVAEGERIRTEILTSSTVGLGAFRKGNALHRIAEYEIDVDKAGGEGTLTRTYNLKVCVTSSEGAE